MAKKTFPQAQGRASEITAGNGGQIILVTNLNDSGAGSLRSALLTSGARIILVMVSGVLNLLTRIEVTEDNWYLLGMTSENGLIITGAEFQVRCSNWCIRYVKFYFDSNFNAGTTPDNFQVLQERGNWILERCSFVGGIDEVLSFPRQINPWTVQDCLISSCYWKWTNAILGTSHDPSDVHNYGSLVGGVGNFIRTVWSHNNRRQPMFWGQRIGETQTESMELRNCMAMNWAVLHTETTGAGDYQFINCYSKPYYPHLLSGDDETMLDRVAFLTIMTSIIPDRVYVSGNIMEGQADFTANNNLGVRARSSVSSAVAAWNANKDTVMQVSEMDMGYVGDTLPTNDVPVYLSQFAGDCLHTDFDHIYTQLRKDILEGINETTFMGGVSGLKGFVDNTSDFGGLPSIPFSVVDPTTYTSGINKDWLISKGLDPNTDYSGIEIIDTDGELRDVALVYANSLVTELYGPIVPPATEFNLTVQSSNISLGTVSRSGSNPVTAGATDVLTATPVGTGVFDGWYENSATFGNLISTENPLTVTMNSDRTIIGRFIDGTPIPPEQPRKKWAKKRGIF